MPAGATTRSIAAPLGTCSLVSAVLMVATLTHSSVLSSQQQPCQRAFALCVQPPAGTPGLSDSGHCCLRPDNMRLPAIADDGSRPLRFGGRLWHGN